MTDKTNEKKQRLLSLLREMFQLDQPDLDFGLYRIMHAKRGQVEAFLETEFDQLIDQVFAHRGARQEDEARKAYEAAKQQAADFGAPDPEAAPKVQQARARYDVIRLTGGEDTEIYDHLYRFFSRYYDAGDFMSLRRYGKGAAGGVETYAIPYDGAEVVLHWANKDQYYIKTTENFSHFSFNPRQALEKDERGVTRQLFDDADSATPLQVHFRLVDAAEGAHNNVKAGDKDERFFLLDGETPIAWEGAELVIRLHYQPDPNKSGQKGKWQDKRNEQTVQTVLAALADETHPQAVEYRAVLVREVPKGKDKKQPLLARYLTRYTASNTMDYFIHKDLGGFLCRELDFYLKNEVLKLDDFVGGEDADVQAGIAETRLKALQTALEKAQAIRLLSQRLIDFLAQLENFQKKLWLKKKFVIETQYCITLDRIPEKYYPEIAANERQREEWVKLFAIDEIKEDLASPGYSVPLTMEFLKANPFLVLDTALISESFKQAILEEIEDLDGKCDGTLVCSENFQALSLVNRWYYGKVSCVYIDPPYNTELDRKTGAFLYKDNYAHSTWATIISNRLNLIDKIFSSDGVLVCSLDDNEFHHVRKIFDDFFGEKNFISTVAVKSRDSVSSDHLISLNHNYLIFYAKDMNQVRFGGFPLDESDYSNPDNDLRGPWKPVPLDANKPGGDTKYGIENPKTGNIYYPPNGRSWAINCDSYQKLLLDKRISFGVNGDSAPKRKLFYRERLAKGDRNTAISLWKDSETTQAGTIQVMDLFGNKAFSYPKPVGLIKNAITISSLRNDYVVMDYFAGSGTTGHAVIDLNRDDGGSRKYLLIEMGEYFYTVLVPRIKKALYSSEWKDGKPKNRISGASQIFKIDRLENYEDTLNNLALSLVGEAVAQVGNAELQRDYLLRYMLDVETQGSQSLLNIAQFRAPTAYQLEIKKPGSDERVKRTVDLVETFNWLIGLHVEKLHAGRSFTATFVRQPDPLLPDDAHTRLQVETLTPQPSPPAPLPQGEGSQSWWFRPVEGYVRTIPGDDRHRQSVLVLWRSLTDDPEQDAAVLEAFLAQQMKFDPNRREDKTLYDVIYLNGTHNLPKLGKYGEVRLLEEEFHRRMWACEEV